MAVCVLKTILLDEICLALALPCQQTCQLERQVVVAQQAEAAEDLRRELRFF